MVEELFEVFEDLFEGRRRKKKGKGGEGEEPAPDARRSAAAATVFCPGCGTRNEGASRFCQECGEILPAVGEEMRCLRCESVVPLTAKFCARCGAKVAVGG